MELLEPVVQNPKARGMQLTLHDPTVDPDGTGAADLVRMLERAFRAG